MITEETIRQQIDEKYSFTNIINHVLGTKIETSYIKSIRENYTDEQIVDFMKMVALLKNTLISINNDPILQKIYYDILEMSKKELENEQQKPECLTC